MRPISFKIKLASLFVLAFLCLNVGGAVCLAYCQSSVKQAALDHCPLQKAGADCHKQIRGGEDRAAHAGAVNCCSLAITFFAAPIEKKQAAPEMAQVAERAKVQGFSIPKTFITQPERPVAFVAPKRNSQRLHLKNCVFRI